LKSSSIFRDRRMREPITRLVLLFAVICLSCPAYAIDPNRTISQYLRERWFSDRGFNGGGVTALSQTPDGYLWIGTDKGLLRFDGSSFRTLQRASPAVPIGPVRALLVGPQGGLWVVLQSTQILRYLNGDFEAGHDEAEFGITSIARLRDGTVLLSSLALGPLQYRANRYQVLIASESSAATLNGNQITADNMSSRLSSATGVATHRYAEPNSPVDAMAETADGKVWLGTRDRGLFYISEGQALPSAKKMPNKINCLLTLQDGDLWIGTDTGMMQLADSPARAIPRPLRDVPIFAMLQDRDGNVWVGTASGLFRLNAHGVSVDKDNTEVTALLEDQEGTVWVGGPRGIECLRDSAFVTYSPPGLNSESTGAIYVDSFDRVWYAPIEGGLRWLKGESSGTVTNDLLSQDITYSIAGSKDELWLARQQGGLTNLRFTGGSFASKTYTEQDGLVQNSVHTVHRNPDGTIWAGTVSGGISRRRDGRFTTYTVADGLASNTVTAMEEGPNGAMWFGTSGGLSELTNGKWRTYTTRDGLPADHVSSILRDGAGTLWIGTSGGLAVLRPDHIQAAGPGAAVLREPIWGLADDQGGSLWIATANHVLRVSREALLQGHLRDTDIRTYGLEDGLQGTEGVKRDRSVVKDSHGGIWFSLNTGLSVVQPNRANHEVLPAVARVEAVLVDGNPAPLRGPIHIPSSQRRLVIDYSALSLVGSDRLRFRYRLDGFDHAWSEPGVSRQAIYTNLGPGSYQFRVAASNSNGLWNGAEAMLPFKIEPAFWQAWWFQLSCVLSLAAFTWLLYRLRLHHLARQFDMRVEERTAERTRIARELHDSLLQGFQGLLLYLQAAQHMLPAHPDDAKRVLEKVLDQGDQALAEARSAVQNLRASAVIPNDLPQALAAIGKELSAPGDAPEFRVIVEGKAQSLVPTLRDEVYRFAREALRNAFGHARAQNIEAEVAYGDQHFVLRVRDDGVGIDPRVLDRGSRPGHWGLPGMRERADSLGAHMEVWSESGAGTEVQLTIPAAIAYEEPLKRERFRFFRSKRTTIS
jgi:ligand-binding sensor domain-containing protein/signal transduction histidine kinase